MQNILTLCKTIHNLFQKGSFC
ncbi:HNH endonuclease [Ascidiimonas meishanensis]